MYDRNFKGSISQTIKKGYQATYDEFFEAQKQNSVCAAYIQGQF